MYAILSVALQSSIDTLLETRDLLQIAKTYSTPVVVLTPDPYLFEQLRDFEVLSVYDTFDPLLLSALITEAVNSIPLATLSASPVEQFDS